MKIKNSLLETVLGQLKGEATITDKNGNSRREGVGLMNTPQDEPYLKRKYVRTLESLEKELFTQFEIFNKDLKEIEKIKDVSTREGELADLMEEELYIGGYTAIPLSWLENINISVFIDIDFLLEIGMLFDDLPKLSSSVKKVEKPSAEIVEEVFNKVVKKKVVKKTPTKKAK